MFIRASMLGASLLAVTALHAQQPKPATAPKQVSKADFTKNLDARFSAIDTNHDGQLEKAEVAAAQSKALERAQAVEQQRLEAEFKKLDTNHDNSLSLVEFKAAGPRLKTNEAPDQMISTLDTNKDGKISAAEYRAPQIGNFDKADANHDGILTAQELQAARKH